MALFRSKQKTRGEQRLRPWEGAMPGLAEATGLAARWIDQPQEFYPGQTFAWQTPAERQGLEMLRAGAGAYPEMLGGLMQPAQQAYREALGAPQAILGAGLQDVAANPALAGVAEAIQSRVNRNLMENILPQLTAGAASRGTLGGTRQQVAEGIAARGTQEALASQLADLYGGAWQAGLGAETSRLGQALGAQAGAMGRAPQLAQLGLSQYTQPATMYQQIGRGYRAEHQRAIDEAMARHQFAQQEPLIRAQTGLGLMQPLATQFGEQKTQTRAGTSPSLFGQIGQIAGLGGALIGGMGGPGAIMGGLRGLFGGGGGGSAPMGGMMADPWGGGMTYAPGPMGYGFGGMPGWGASMPY